MEQHIRLIVLKHLRDQFHVHILDVDVLCSGCHQHPIRSLHSPEYGKTVYLQALVHDHHRFIEFFLQCLSVLGPGGVSSKPWLGHTMLLMIRDRIRACWCSWGLSWLLLATYQQSNDSYSPSSHGSLWKGKNGLFCSSRINKSAVTCSYTKTTGCRNSGRLQYAPRCKQRLLSCRFNLNCT